MTYYYIPPLVAHGNSLTYGGGVSGWHGKLESSPRDHSYVISPCISTGWSSGFESFLFAAVVPTYPPFIPPCSVYLDDNMNDEKKYEAGQNGMEEALENPKRRPTDFNPEKLAQALKTHWLESRRAADE